MTFQEVLTALRTRWYAFTAVLLCVAAVGYLAIREKPLYQATAVVALVPPKEPSVPNQLAAATPSLAAVGVAVDDLLASGAIDSLGLVSLFFLVETMRGEPVDMAQATAAEAAPLTARRIVARWLEGGAR